LSAISGQGEKIQMSEVSGFPEYIGWVNASAVKPEMAFSKEELEQIRAGFPPEAGTAFDRLLAEGLTPFKPVFVVQPVEQEQAQKPWEPADGTPGKAAEPQRDRM
jgi:hypothetical protein